MKNNSKMKAAERQINRLEYAFNIIKEAGVAVSRDAVDHEESKEQQPQFDPIRDIKNISGKSERVLITRIFNKSRFEGWHPTLGEFDISDGAPKKDFKTRELEKA